MVFNDSLTNNKRLNNFYLPTTSKINSFNKDLCKTLLAANIPLNKLQNTYFRSFLEKYTHKDIPSVSLLRIVPMSMSAMMRQWTP